MWMECNRCAPHVILAAFHRAAYAARGDSARAAHASSEGVASAAAGSACQWAMHVGPDRAKANSKAMAGLLRDIAGNPFRSGLPFDPTWLVRNSGSVLRMGQAIYDAREFASLPILADALEDAGCADRAILDHCRGSGPHVRGCWVVDL